jgi:eukaryotic-like serine/threonine-protein kinase
MALAPLQGGDPQAIGGYRVIGRLGAGGMGVVFLADKAGQLVAIKQMRAELADDAGFRARFGREAIALTRVQSTCTARVLAVVSDVPHPFLVMEYVAGPSVADHVVAVGPLPPLQVRAMAIGLAAALTSIHTAGVVHRDLKPANVLLGPDGPRVIDFGIAQVADATALTRTGTAIGSAGYMAPEQLSGSAGTPADVFAWALTVVFAATGRPPFGTGPVEALLYRVVHAEPDMVGTPDGLLPAVRAALAKDPAARPTAAALLHGLLGGDLPAEQDQQVAEAAVTRIWSEGREADDVGLTRRPRRRVIPAVVAIVALLAAGLVAVLIGQLPTPAGAGTGTATTTTQPTGTASTTATTSGMVTRVTIYQPWTPDGISGRIAVTGRANGSCFGTSAAVGRTDAFRCTAGDVISDPCFASPYAGQDPQVACPDPDVDHVLLITLTEPVPDPLATPTSSRSWLLQLAGGATCTALTGATAVAADLRQNYGCTDGGDLYGDPDTSSATWTIHYQAKDSPGLEVVPISAAYG